ncbi:ATP-binding protein [Paludisphaera rhizosphaerae]|uniref:ATP-binding protein n=1 Tax=Paludisphaera rhizosphaerae TaxID=2711216 RepID=UPI0013EB8333|nr:ATP-binding protein [Paludisphaera rhizosphaerae]
MRFQSGRTTPGEPLLGRLYGLARLPVRPHSARVVAAVFADAVEAEDDESGPVVPRTLPDLDPGWLAAEATPGSPGALQVLANAPWWPSATASGPAAEAIQKLWRHAVATASACRSLAKEHDDRDPDGLIRAGMLHGLGRWALAAVDPERLALWLAEPDREARRRREIAELGLDLREVGRCLAERWGCDPLIVDAAWLYGEDDADLLAAAREPARLALVREAIRRAEATPWALDPPDGRTPAMPADPRLRILVAEVQARTGAPFTAADASPFEERAVRDAARLRIRLAEMTRTAASRQRLIDAVADSVPDETPENWAVRAGRAWCGEPEVNAARVVWREPRMGAAAPGLDDEPESENPSRRGASWTIPLESAGESIGEIQLWLDADVQALHDRLGPTRVIEAWKSWSAHVAGRALQDRRLRAAVEGSREASRSARARLQTAKLDALAEFAAGAGHELNNPLAVIVGRAQLLQAKAEDPETKRSLGIILSQAQRTHRILRDLMFIARPGTSRPRLCRPADVLRACLADFQAECESRGLRLVGEFDEPEQQAWTDPDGLRHVADVLIRNALQASSGNGGGTIRLRAGRQGRELRIQVADTGKGIAPTEAPHLFDPFFCGRQAGRGLGLGLARAARIVERAGGSLTWDPAPGQGSIFHVRIPWERPPEEPAARGA